MPKKGTQIDQTKWDAITTQSLSEISFARNAKQINIDRWWKNEDLYYSRKPVVLIEEQRANINLNEAQSFVQTFLSKINAPYNFKYTKGDEADLKAAKVTNAIKDKDAKLGRWSFKAMVARVQLIIYGRYIFQYHADKDSKGKYCSHLNNVDVYQFLIDSSCGGVDIDAAFYLGRGGIVKGKKQLNEGVASGRYNEEQVKLILAGNATTTMESKEDQNARNRWITLLAQTKQLLTKDEYKFWEWYTTYEGDRYYVLVSEDSSKAIRIEKLTDMFKTEMWPFFTAAAYPDLTEFWTPSPLDGAREPIQAKAVAINQMLDNGEQINRPMKAFDVDAIKNPALLKYRSDGLIPVKSGVDIEKAVKFFSVIPIETSMETYDKLDQIVNVQSGVTAGARGNATEDKVGIYQGNQANAADRFTLIGDSEADAQQRFATLYLQGLDMHMTDGVAVEMIGIEGVEYFEARKIDIGRSKEFGIVVVTAGTEQTMETVSKKNKLTFLQEKAADPNAGEIYNKRVLAEMEASIAGFDPDEVKRILDTKEYGNAELMSEAARDIRTFLDGGQPKPNQAATVAYQQKILDYLRDEQDNIKPEISDKMFAYISELDPFVFRNMQVSINDQLAKEGLPTLQGIASGQRGQAAIPQAPENPLQPVVPPNGAVPPAAPVVPVVPAAIAPAPQPIRV